jgi:predicted transcriptional regulator
VTKIGNVVKMRKTNKMKERLIKFLAHLGIGQNKFAKNVGLSEGYFSTVRDNITVETVKKILAVYPELNINWLLTGEGEMLKTEAPQETEKPPVPTQLEIDFSKIAEANLKIANAVESMTVTADRNSRTMEKTTDNNTKLIDVNKELIEKLLSAIDRIEKKIDKKGAVAGAGGAAKPAAQG